MRIPWRVQQVLNRLWSLDTVLVFRKSREDPALARPATRGPEVLLKTCLMRDVEEQLPLPLPARIQKRRRDFSPTAHLHAIVCDGRVASWGISELAVRDWPISESGTRLPIPDRSTVLLAFETLPEYRRRGYYLLLLYEILRLRFAEGAAWAYLWCVEENVASKNAIEKAGFSLVERHERRNVLGFARRRISP